MDLPKKGQIIWARDHNHPNYNKWGKCIYWGQSNNPYLPYFVLYIWPVPYKIKTGTFFTSIEDHKEVVMNCGGNFSEISVEDPTTEISDRYYL